MANTFYGPLDANVAIPAPQCMSGGTMNFNFGSDRPGNNGTPSYRQLVPFSMVPFPPDPDFVDRPDILGWLREKFTGVGARAALVGLGGVGKSQLAIRFAHSIHETSPQTFVFWVHASSRTQFEKAYKDIADRLQIPERNDPKTNVLSLVANWLRDKTNGNWIMVLDNVDHVDIFSPSRKRRLDEADTNVQMSLATYLPQSTGSILVTSRNRDAAAGLVGYNRIKEVLAMDERQGLQLLRNKLCQPPLEESAANLLFALGHIPLAIAQAAAYINRSARMSVTDYLHDFHKNSKKRERLLNWDLGDLRRDESASNSILTTWQMSFEQIRRERPSAAELLSVMSFFHPQGIPEWILRKFRKTPVGKDDSGDFPNDEDDDSDDESEFDEDLNILRAYSLISATTENNTYEMHPLVQFCMQAWLSSFGEFDQWYHRFVVLIDQELLFEPHERWAKFRQLFPHLERLFDSTPAKETLREWANLTLISAVYIVQEGRYATAQKVAEKALSVTEHALGFNDGHTLSIANFLIFVLRQQDRLQEAEKLGQRVLREYKEPGERDVYIMDTMQELAKTMQNQRRYDEFEKLVQQIIESYKEEREPFMVGRLASYLQTLGRLEEAEKGFRQAIEACKEQVGERHHRTLGFMSRLVDVLMERGEWLEAEKFLRQTLEAKKEQLGEHHVETLKSIYDLATALNSKGRLVEAEKLLWQVMEGSKDQGEYSIFTVASMMELLTILFVQSRNEEALKLIRQLISGLNVWREQLSIFSDSFHASAAIFGRLGQYTEAEELYQRAYTGYMDQRGPQDPLTIKCYEGLAALREKIQQAGSGEETGSNQSTQDTSLE